MTWCLNHSLLVKVAEIGTTRRNARAVFFLTRKRNQKLELEARDPWIRLVQMGEHWILDIDVDRFVGYYIESIDVFFSKFAVDLGLFGF